MNTSEKGWGRWWVVVTYAVAMAWLEAAVVLYLRTLVNRLDPYQPEPLPRLGNLGPAEIIREGATVIMLGAVGWLAGRNLRTRFGYFIIAFGVWDIFYYVFLKPLTAWPRSLTDWDLLFLIPLPWWGPVWAPMSIAMLMALYGTALTQFEHYPSRLVSKWKPWLSVLLGIALALYVFMADAIRVAGQGADVVRNVLPVAFNWPLFALALVLMAAPLAVAGWPFKARREIVMS